MIELNNLSTAALSDEGVEFELRHPVTGDPLGAFVILRGLDSKAARDVETRFRREIVEAAGKTVDPIEWAERAAMEKRVALTVGFIDLTVNGKEPDPATLYADPGFSWLVEQVDRFIQDRRNFFPKA